MKWVWRDFKNGARTDGLRLSHWTKAGTDPNAGMSFVVVEVVDYELLVIYICVQSTRLRNIISSRIHMSTRRMSTLVFLKVCSFPSMIRLKHALEFALDKEWSKPETDYLFQLVREYDGRFYVVGDRYDFPNGPTRSLEVR